MHSLSRRLAAETIGTGFLLMAVVGGGIAAERLSPTDAGLQLFEAAVVTAFALTALIWMFLPISGAHFNPAVTLADVFLGGRPLGEAAAYVAAQVAGALGGTVVANLMFELDAVSWSNTARGGQGRLLGELVATLGLVLVIFLLAQTSQIRQIAPAVGLYIGAAYFFTSSTSFANPAVTIGRQISDTFSGIDPASVPFFILMQVLGTALAIGLIRWLAADPAFQA